MIDVVFNGAPAGLFASLPQALRQAEATTHDWTATLLINITKDAEQGIDAAEAFARRVPAKADALVINVLPGHRQDDWAGTRAAATLWAFTRYAALVWAPRGIRVNALSLGPVPATPDQPRESAGRAASDASGTAYAPATPADIVATVLAFCRLRSMTGQLIRLGAEQS